MKSNTIKLFTLMATGVLLLTGIIPTLAGNLLNVSQPAAVVAPEANAIVNVAHFAPFATGLDNTAVTVRVNGGNAITDFKYGDIQQVNLPGGDYLIEIIPDILGTVAISASVTLEDDMQYTLAAIGDGANQSLDLFAMVDDTQPLTDSAKLRVTHLAPFAAGMARVDICTDSGTEIIPDFDFKEFTDPYLELPAGDYDLVIALDGTSCGTVAFDIPSVRLMNGDIVDVFAIGGANGFPVGVASTTGFDLTPPTRVNIAHYAPFATDTAGESPLAVSSTAVTVTVNGSPVLTDFVFGEDSGYLTLDPGDYLVEVIPQATGTVALSGTLTLDPGMDYTAAAIGGANGYGLEFYVLEDDNSAPTVGNAKIRISHLAPFDPDLADTQVDICTQDGSVVGGLVNVPYKGSSGYLSLPAGDYDLKVTAAGTNCGTTLIEVPSLRLADGEIVDVFAVGDGVNQPVGLASTTGFTLTPAKVIVAHFAPFAAGLDNTSVTVKVNGSPALTDVKFGAITNYLEFAPAEYLIEIVPTGTTTVAISGTFTLDPAMEYTLAAIGDGTNQPLELFALVDDNSQPMTGTARLRVSHFAPFASTGTEVDICTETGSVVPGLAGVPYKGFTDPYLELPAGLYDLKVTVAGSSCATLLFDIPVIKLDDGQVASVFAVGGANGFAPMVLTVPDLTPFRVFLALINK
jgi:hypothetical protein